MGVGGVGVLWGRGGGVVAHPSCSSQQGCMGRGGVKK